MLPALNNSEPLDELVPIDEDTNENIGNTNAEFIENVEKYGALEPSVTD